MDQVVTILIIVVLVIVVLSALSKSNSSNSKAKSGGRGREYAGRTNAFTPWPNAELPTALGVPYGHPARTAAERLESALGIDFESRVKDRVLKEFPKISDKEWN